MKILKSKETLKNIAFVAFLLILFFTPIGKEMRVWVAKLRVLVLNPSVESVEDQQKLSDSDFQWQLMDYNGNIESLSENKGELILINYWATWCPPCIAEMPSFQNLYNDYGGKMKFIFLTTDDKETVDAFMQKKDFSFPIYFQIKNAPPKLHTSSLPTTFLIDQNGNIVIDEVGASDWNSDSMRATLDKLLLD